MGTVHQSQYSCLCSLAAAAKIGAPDGDMSPFLGDIDYYSLMGLGTQAPLASRARQ